MGGLSLEIIRDGRQLAGWEDAWWELWRRTPGATPFQSPAWLLAWQRQFAPTEVRTGLALQAGRLVGLFPFYCENGEAGERLLPLGISLSDYLDVLVEPEAVASQALAALLADVDYEQWSFEELPPGAIALDLPLPPGHAESSREQSACPVLTLRGGSDLSDCVPTRRLRQLRRAWAAAKRMGESSLPRRRTARRSSRPCRCCMRRVGRPGTRRACSRIRTCKNFIARRCRAWSRPVSRAAMSLTIGSRPAAAYYGFCDRGRAFAYIGGFDPAFVEASPGAILIGHAIAQAIGEGGREFHFLRGREPYKYTWGASDRWNRRREWSKRDAAQ